MASFTAYRYHSEVASAMPHSHRGSGYAVKRVPVKIEPRPKRGEKALPFVMLISLILGFADAGVKLNQSPDVPQEARYIAASLGFLGMAFCWFLFVLCFGPGSSLAKRLWRRNRNDEERGS